MMHPPQASRTRRLPLLGGPAVAIRLAVAMGLAACGLGDSDLTDCRCAEDTDVAAFPKCLNEELLPREDAENPLATRVPDCPSGKRLFLREPTSPEAVLFNIRDTITGFSPIQYMDQLDERFLFVPDVDALELYQEVFNPPSGYDPETDVDTLWTREQERQFIVNLLDKEKFQSIEFDRWYDSSRDERRITEDNLQEMFDFPYRVTFTEKPREGVATEIFAISGRVYATVTTPTAETPVWIVTRWRDFRDLASVRRSWTELRGEFSP